MLRLLGRWTMLFVMSSLGICHLVVWYDDLPTLVQYLTVLAQALWYAQVVIWLGIIEVSTQEWTAVVYRLLVIGATYAIVSRLPDISRFLDRLAEILPL